MFIYLYTHENLYSEDRPMAWLGKNNELRAWLGVNMSSCGKITRFSGRYWDILDVNYFLQMSKY